jgi:hypothetical protein
LKNRALIETSQWIWYTHFYALRLSSRNNYLPWKWNGRRAARTGRSGTRVWGPHPSSSWRNRALVLGHRGRRWRTNISLWWVWHAHSDRSWRASHLWTGTHSIRSQWQLASWIRLTGAT